MPLTPDAPILDPRLLDHFKRRFFNCDFVIQHLTQVADGSGGVTTDWTQTPLEVLGAIHSLSAQEREATGGAGETTTHEVVIAFVAGVDATMRISYGARVFDIQSVIDPAEQHLLLTLMVAERFRK